MTFPPSLYRTPLQINGYVPRVWQQYFKDTLGNFPNSLAQTRIVRQDGTVQYVWLKYFQGAKAIPDSLARTPLHDRNGNVNRVWLKYLETI